MLAGLGDKMLGALAGGLLHLPRATGEALRELHLLGCGIGPQGMRALTPALASLPGLQILDLSDNRLAARELGRVDEATGLAPDAAEALAPLAKALAEHPQLRDVRLRGVRMGDRVV